MELLPDGAGEVRAVVRSVALPIIHLATAQPCPLPLYTAAVSERDDLGGRVEQTGAQEVTALGAHTQELQHSRRELYLARGRRDLAGPSTAR